MKNLLLLIGLFFSINIFCQQSSVYGKITDEENGEDLLYANVVLEKNGVFAAGGTTDFEGNYSIIVDPGTYDVIVTYTGFMDRIITDVVVVSGKAVKLDIQLSLWDDTITILPVLPPCIYIPLISHDETSTGEKIYSEEIRKLGTKDINEILLSTPGVSLDRF